MMASDSHRRTYGLLEFPCRHAGEPHPEGLERVADRVLGVEKLALEIASLRQRAFENGCGG